MTDILLWIVVCELTLGLILGGYVLYEIQTALAVIVLHECGDEPDPEVILPPALTPDLQADNQPQAREDEQETIGTFTGAAWR